MLRSLRSRLIFASVLWTSGLLALMHLAFLFSYGFPGPRDARSIAAMSFSVFFMAAGFWAARRSLVPLRGLRGKLAAVRLGEGRSVEGAYPSEIQPLIDELNALLDDREKAVRRALATAGDLAHGLKTPLALLEQEAERAEAEGSAELADSISQQVGRMARQVNYHLARARAAASGAAGAAPCLVLPCIEGLARTVSRLYRERSVRIEVAVASDLAVRVQREDLEEMLGELMENACKWAKTEVCVGGAQAGGKILLTVDDDGAGLAPSLRAAVLERGVRADEAAPGSGLGLAIVRDLAEIYGGRVTLGESPQGGLRAEVSLPAA